MQTKRISLLFSLCLLLSWSLRSQCSVDLHEQISLATDSIFEKLVEVRRDLHQYPELAKEEKRTQAVIRDYLLELGLEVKTDQYGYSVIGILQGKQPGKKIAWRADMDAIASSFPERTSFRSKIYGIQHGCGHDIHMAIGLGIAEVLSKQKDYISGTVYFIFQPEEETFVGAKKMVEEGLFSTIDPDEIYALHVTALPAGKIMVKPAELYAYQKRIQIAFRKDFPESEAQHLYEKIKGGMFRSSSEVNPWELRYMSDPKLGLSSPNTIFQNYRIMDANAWTTSEEDRFTINANLYETEEDSLKNIIPDIERIICATGNRDALLSTTFTLQNPTVMNDEALTQSTRRIFSSIYGEDLLLPSYGQLPFFNDDFCYFQHEVPGVYLLLGGSNVEKEMVAMNHAPNFRIDEECIRVGVRSFSSLIVERLK
ncbi:MAG: M20/M25/M40 family metallo-hydrolase [Bacteroidota bacterium]